jgi:hypothetical protein
MIGNTTMRYTGTIFNRDFEVVVKRYKEMRAKNPRAYSECMHAFQVMAAGEGGPAEYVVAAGGPVPVRMLYFKDWNDASFLELLFRLSKDRAHGAG